jgi:signal transduction histidine kinase
MRAQAEIPPGLPTLRHAAAETLRSRWVRYGAGVLALAVAYYAAGKIGQTLRYTASVAAIWPPAGLGIASLYLWGTRWWPGVFVGDLLINLELLVQDASLPVGSLVGQQVGNMAEIIVGAMLLRRLIGPRAALDRAEQVGGMLVALGLATAISATVGTASMFAGGVIDRSELATFWRTWWLGDTTGALVMVPLLLAWAPQPVKAWRRVGTWEGGLLIFVLAVLGTVAFTTHASVRYIVLPALIWAAFRFGPSGATLSIAITAGIAIGFTANDVGPFSQQPIDQRTLGTQLYLFVAALTALFLSAAVSERERAAIELADLHRREGERAVEERRRIARDLHDSVSQAMFSTALYTRTAQKALREEEHLSDSGPLGRALETIGELTRAAQGEMRAFISQLDRAGIEDGLLAALSSYATSLGSRHGLTIDILGPEDLSVSQQAEAQLFSIGREALTNVVKHAGARRAWVRVDALAGHILVEIRDDGHGFESATVDPNHFGILSMHSRAEELGGYLTVVSTPGQGTVVRAEVPADGNGPRDAA